MLEYVTMMRRVARMKNRRLAIVPVPLLTPGFSSRWLALVTDVDTQTGRSLIDSMSNEAGVMGTLFALQRRASGGLQAPMLTHLA